MTTYEKIKALLELNTLRGVAVQHKNSKWRVFTNIDGDGALGATYLRDIMEDCLSTGSSSFMYSKEDIEKSFVSEVFPMPMKPKTIPVGTKVEILDIMKESGDFNSWNPIKKCSTDGTVVSVWDDYRGVHYDVLCSNGKMFTYPSYCIAPYFDYEEEDTVKDTRERIVLNGKTYVLED